MRLDLDIVSKLTQGILYSGANLTNINKIDIRGHWARNDGKNFKLNKFEYRYFKLILFTFYVSKS